MGPGTLESTGSVCMSHCSLMSAGQEPDFPGDEAFASRFPVHRACRDGDVGALVSLTEQLAQSRAHLAAEDSCCGWTPLHWAAHYGQLECVVRLVQMGCGVNTVTSRFNQTPTHTAAFGGHPHCVVWLTQAGADVNRQDFVGEAPIHKAARSGSLECVQVLLIAGAKPHLRNASGQTAADLAHAHGFLDCFRFVSNPQEHLLQPDGLRESGVQNGSGPWGQGSLSRKRLPASVDSGHTKKARRAEDVLVQVHGSGAEEVESMSVEESAQELGPVDDTKGVTNGHHQTLPRAAQDEPEPPKTSPPPANRPATAVSTQRSSPDMCGSLHLTGSPSSCVSQRPAWWGLMGADCRDFQHYGHYHGFGDTAEELSDSGHVQYGGIQAEHRYKQAVAGTVHLYHSS
ncbi:ankyrin repeat domain-containing protein 10 isoform X2 [Scophthalmus maximus]|uniref:ankyrin repeat domain-containing protein 10 isoform X2 n=1 Tax=Scophthalmus maximus TaxID=52904 RepID=UPI0015E12BA7|nr:ankyrin repeat domain-containing protein 10 isoform X2 [Scophthalmus maximus]